MGAHTIAARTRRCAFVVGNSAYEFADPLPNPRTDAADMSKALECLGFNVTPCIDRSRVDMMEALRSFQVESADCEEVVFYYSGDDVFATKVSYGSGNCSVAAFGTAAGKKYFGGVCI